MQLKVAHAIIAKGQIWPVSCVFAFSRLPTGVVYMSRQCTQKDFRVTPLNNRYRYCFLSLPHIDVVTRSAMQSMAGGKHERGHRHQ